jgi:integrase/recombinase XerC
LNEEEITRLSVYLHSLENDKNNTRLKAVFCFLILQGFRQCEITRLKIANIDLVNKTAQVMGKGRDDYEMVNLHPETAKHIEVYLKENKLSDGYLFPSRSNKNLHNQLTVRGLRAIIKEVLGELNILKNVHGFRHFFTTKLIKNYNGDLLEVARYTRHRSLEMLQVYNDGIKQKEDLPRYYKTFNQIKF